MQLRLFNCELEELTPEIVKVSERVELAQVLFNNNHEDQGQRNAADLILNKRADRICPSSYRDDAHVHSICSGPFANGLLSCWALCRRSFRTWPALVQTVFQ